MTDGPLGAFSDLLRAHADELEVWDAEGGVPREFVASLASTGVLGAMLGPEAGGTAWTVPEYVTACRRLAGHSPSAQTLLTAHAMVCRAVERWGSASSRKDLEPLARGEALGAFALTDDSAGSDARRLGTSAVEQPGGWRLDGVKRWVCFGLQASHLLVFAKADQGDVAFVVLSSDPGVRIEPDEPVRGLATAHLAKVHLEGTLVAADRMVARPGFAVSQVATRTLRLGRLCVAAGALGIAERCRDLLIAHSTSRQQFGGPLSDLGGVRSKIAEAALSTLAAEHCVREAAEALEHDDPEVERLVIAAKLTATAAATTAARAAAQVHGARGLVAGSVVDRRVQDARAMEIIEGNTELLTDAFVTQSLAEWRQRRQERAVPREGGQIRTGGAE
ncbi:acyl-CoA dehydrogenase family protein [Streptomyces sp. NPDC050388]|uniref:acyl-CoA dehydrogenase family protein n=1 Tax=Streptomyces sp. NPDC050388 TaxID=3155781 RepID=UPI003424DE21